MSRSEFFSEEDFPERVKRRKGEKREKRQKQKEKEGDKGENHQKKRSGSDFRQGENRKRRRKSERGNGRFRENFARRNFRPCRRRGKRMQSYGAFRFRGRNTGYGGRSPDGEK